ncbi:putative RNA-directed DNA polymerase from transposon BS [Fusarium oxysporum f. sp. albedinis]|nr:putative RNA-directed DNA polymerase from transposon BS [Fusarium oxysporum f. sp. albedinis]
MAEGSGERFSSLRFAGLNSQNSPQAECEPLENLGFRLQYLERASRRFLFHRSLSILRTIRPICKTFLNFANVTTIVPCSSRWRGTSSKFLTGP